MVEWIDVFKTEEGPHSCFPEQCSYISMSREDSKSMVRHTAESCNDIDGNDNQDTFNWTREISEKQDSGVVLFPSRQIKVGECESL